MLEWFLKNKAGERQDRGREAFLYHWYVQYIIKKILDPSFYI